MKRWAVAAAILVTAATRNMWPADAQTSAATVPPVLGVTLRVKQAHPEYEAERARLLSDVAAFNGRTQQFNAACGAVSPDNASAIADCTRRQSDLEAERRALVARIGTFNHEVAAALENTPYRPSGNGLVGGTGWIVGYNVPPASPELEADARAMLAAQERLAGHPYSDAVDFKRYNFVIGIAAEASFAQDLIGRVLMDEPTAGAHSIDTMPGYAALAGRSFHLLSCHSNGAMVCLAALARKDVKADNVVLYGPQLTETALKMWEQLVKSGRVRAVTIVVNTGDVVPPLSLAFEDYVESRLQNRRRTYQDMALLRTSDLTAAVTSTAPHVGVVVHPCTFRLTDPLYCHSNATYQAEAPR